MSPRRPPPLQGRAHTGRLRRLLSRLPARLLAFNLLLVLVPVGGLFSFGLHELLGRYERRLLDAQERSMAQQGRLLAAALADVGDVDELQADEAERILAGLEQRLTARLRVYDADGRVLADSARLGPRRDRDGALEGEDARRRARHVLALPPGRRAVQDLAELDGDGAPSPPPRSAPPPDADAGPPAEIVSALAGRYGAEARPTPGDPARSPSTWPSPCAPASGSSAPPRRPSPPSASWRSCAGCGCRSSRSSWRRSSAPWCSRSSPRRPSPGRSAACATEAATLVDRRGRLQGTFSGSNSADEVGDLARALESLSRRIDQHVRFVESFAADVSHELKNPLTSIRAATELLPDAEDPDERRRLLATVASDVSRMERLLSAIREISLIDSRLDEEPVATVELAPLLEEVVRAIRTRAPEGVGLTLELPDPGDRQDGARRPLRLRAAPERIAQVVENLVDNAFGFAPAGSAVEVRLRAEPASASSRAEARTESREADAVITVADRGPGIPPEHLERIFDRFFTYRPGRQARPGPRRAEPHTGLGLAIVQAIVDAYGGEVGAHNRPDGGACVEVRLPIPSRATPDPAGRSATARD